MKIGDRIYVRGYIDEIRKDTVIVRNDGGYFGTIPSEVTGDLPSAQLEPLTDIEQRIFLAAMRREEDVCKQVDAEWRDCREPYEDSLVSICHKIIRKVKGALWTYYDCTLLDRVDVRYVLSDLPSAQPEQRWIPCSERLPEDIRPVIVTWKNTDPAPYYQDIFGKHFTDIACYKSGKWYWYSSTTEDILAEYGRYDSEEFDEAIECIAWQPLPEPYQGD